MVQRHFWDKLYLLNDSDVLVEAENGAGLEERLIEKDGDHVVDVDHLVGNVRDAARDDRPDGPRAYARDSKAASLSGGYRRFTRRVETGMKKAKGILAGDAFSL